MATITPSQPSFAALRRTDPATFNYTTLLPFEREFEIGEQMVWMQANWQQSFLYSLAYIVFIWIGRQWMKERPRFELRGALIAWNLGLAAFSILGLIRVLPEFVSSLYFHGLQYSICNASYGQGVTSLWAWWFALSKVFELGDTAFIVLRKQPLIFLHYYHHTTVLVYTWYSFQQHLAPGRWFIVMNFTVHSLMYSYYAARAAGYRPPRCVPMVITVMQLAQMVVGCAISVRTYYIKERGEFCEQTYEKFICCLSMYASYFLLFAHFFFGSYYGSNAKFAKSAASNTASSPVCASSKKLKSS
uniref:Elongation of very long chain fatty acids protein n=1 Tax=Plectus sambesii TaxID=2011161 RepID=A0A914XPP7_9BILA